MKDRKLSVNVESSGCAECGRCREAWQMGGSGAWECDRVSSCRKVEVAGARCKGRNRKTWKECVDDDMEVLGLHQGHTNAFLACDRITLGVFQKCHRREKIDFLFNKLALGFSKTYAHISY